jgi:hypothetical protein
LLLIAGHYHKYQTLHFDEALQIALSESLDIHNSTKEEQDLALAIQMSLVNEEPDQQIELCCSNRGNFLRKFEN